MAIFIDLYLKIEVKNNKFPISLIIAKTNPYRAEIFEAFVQMSMNNKK